MKKKVLPISFIVALFALAGCNDNKNSASDSTSTAPSTSASTSASTSTSLPDEPKVISNDEIIDKVSKGIKAQSKIKSGEQVGSSTTNYEYGKDKYGDFVLIKGYSTTYYGHNASNKIYGISVGSNDTLSTPSTVVDENIYGPSFYTMYKQYYGVEGLMNFVLETIKENANKDFQGLSLKDDEVIKFQVGKTGLDYSSNVTLTIINIEFSVTDEAFTQLKYESATYNNSDITADYETGTYTVKEDATANIKNSVTYNQVIGERTLTNPYDIETMYYDSIEFLDSNNESMKSEYTFSAGTSLAFTLGSFAPSTANSAIDKISVTLPTGVSGLTGYFYNNTLTINCFNEGTYEATISTAKTSKQVTFHVTKALPASISVNCYYLEGNYYSSDVIDNESPTFDLFVNSEVLLNASMTPSIAEQGFTAELLENSDKASLTEVTFKPSQFANNIKAYKFVASEAGTYSVKLSSSVASTVNQTIALNVQEAPDFSSLISKRYARSSMSSNGLELLNDVTFAPNAIDNKTGTVTIIDGSVGTTNTYNYTYNEATRLFSLTDSDGNAVTTVGLSFSPFYNLVISIISGDSTMKLVLEEFSVESVMNRSNWTGLSSDNAIVGLFFTGENEANLTINKYIDGSDSIGVNINVNFAISETDDGYVVSLDAASLALIADNTHIDSFTSIVIAKNFKKVSISISIDGTAQTIDMTYTRG